MAFLSEVATYFRTGGPFMIFILGVGVIALALVLERMWVIGRASALNGSRFAADLGAHIDKGEVEQAANLAREVKAPAGMVALHGIAAGTRSPEAVMDGVDAAAAVVLPPLSRRLPHLPLLANVATLLGLLGTIFGLTTAFSAVSAADPAQRSTFLAAGISQALNTTSFGLIVAVPLLILHGMLTAKVEGLVGEIDALGIRLTEAFRRRQRDTASGTSREAA